MSKSFLKSTTIMARIIFPVLFVSFILTIIAGVSIFKLKGLERDVAALTMQRIPAMQNILSMEASVRAVSSGKRGLSVLGLTGVIRKAERKTANQGIINLNDMMEEYSTSQKTPGELQHWESLKVKIASWQAHHKVFMDLSDQKDKLLAAGETEKSSKIIDLEAKMLDNLLADRKFLDRIDENMPLLSGAVIRETLDRGEASQTSASRAVWLMLIVSVVGLLSSLGFGIVMARRVAQALKDAIYRLEQESSNTKSSSESVASAAYELAQASTEQAAALQETAVSIERMSEMIMNNSHNTDKSANAVQMSLDAVKEGRESAELIVEAMNGIHVSNESIMKQVEESNIRITEISKVISEIGDKTKVINDIVFQTKLLSFNASVEAARAGEAGKGFAVVAEEVGNLAAMSGSAALDITLMIESSVKKVEAIVEDTKIQMEANIQSGRTKLNAGIKVVGHNKDILENIAGKVDEVNVMIGEIALATREQSDGISEISKAMGQLDQLTNNNTTAGQQISDDSEQLKQQATSLGLVLRELQSLVWGEGQSIVATTTTVPSADRIV